MSADGTRFSVTVLVAGRRVTGETWAKSDRAAVVNVAARFAREFGADVGAAVAGALRDKQARVTPVSGGNQQPNTGGNHAGK